jgi:hypothetical protein
MKQQEEKYRGKGYKIIFSTDLSDNEIESEIDDFLRKVDARQAMAHIEEMSEEEIYKITEDLCKS